MQYLIYFIGPFVLGLIGAKLVRQRFRVFAIGLVTFLAAWIVMQTTVAVGMSAGIGQKSIAFALLVSAVAGICEESARYIVFRNFRAFRGNQSWDASFGYALGHHGMETIIVGLTLLLTMAVVRYKPDAISDPVTLQEAQAAVALGTGVQLYNAFERLFVGLLIHACFSAVVMMAVVTGLTRWLFVAGGWHFLHNMVGFTLARLPYSEITSKVWIAVIVVGYTILLVKLYHVLRRTELSVGGTVDKAPPPSMILPGRSA